MVVPPAAPPLPHWSRRAFLSACGTAGAAVAVGGLTACSAGARSSTGGRAAGGLAIGLGAKPSNLDFTTTAGAAIPQALLYNVYEGLVKLDATGTIVPLLASSWTVSDDRLRYDFQLRDGVTFSDGSSFSADTVKFSLERVAENWTANAPASLDVVADVTVVSPTQVTITLKAPSNGWLFAMAGPVGTMFTPSGVDALATTAIGTGPFVVDEFDPGTHLTLARNRTYWGTPAPLDAVTLTYYDDTTAATNALLSGGLDVVYSVSSPQLLEQFAGNDRFTVVQGTSTGEVMMAMNSARAPLSDPRVRQAVMHAVDRQTVLDIASFGYGTLIGSMVPPTDPWYDPSLVDLYPYDPDRARSLLADAGVEDLDLAFGVPNLPYATACAQVVKAQLAEVGITASIATMEFPAVWLDTVFTRHDYDLSVIAHTEPRDITVLAQPSSYLGYDNPEVVAMFAAADAADPQDYVPMMKEASARMAQDAPADWLYLAPLLTVQDARVSGIPPDATSLSLDLTAATLA